jgi:hypothetical protein
MSSRFPLILPLIVLKLDNVILNSPCVFLALSYTSSNTL